MQTSKLQDLYPNGRQINFKKYKDLQKRGHTLTEAAKAYYKNLPHDGNDFDTDSDVSDASDDEEQIGDDFWESTDKWMNPYQLEKLDVAPPSADQPSSSSSSSSQRSSNSGEFLFRNIFWASSVFQTIFCSVSHH